MRLRHKDKTARFRFFAVPGDCPVFLGMHDLEKLGILKIMCEVVGGKQGERKFFSKTINHPAPQTAEQTQTGGSGQIIWMSLMVIHPDYFMSSLDREADKRASQV